MGTKTTIEFNEAAAKELERMAATLQASSKAEIIRNALSLYSFIMKELVGRSGRDLAVVQNGEIKTVIAVPGLTIGKAEEENTPVAVAR